MSWRRRRIRWGFIFRSQQYLKNSLWVVPFLGGVVGVILAQVGLWLDTLGFLSAWNHSPETETAVVSATISAVASLTGFVVTVAVLGVQMATDTFSPRYMRMWYRDGRLKLLLAVLVGTLPGLPVARHHRDPRVRGDSVQVVRRLDATAGAAFADRIDRDLAGGADAQGIGGPARHHVETAAP